jgi:phage FluMu protein Com
MKTAQQNTLRCLSCGSLLNRVEGSESLECNKCGEVFDLEVLSGMELDLDECDRMLQNAFRNKRVSKRHRLCR